MHSGATGESSEVARDTRWLWFDLRGPHVPSRSRLERADGDLAHAVVALEPALATAAASNRRAFALFVSGIAASLVAVVVWRAVIYGAVFPAFARGAISGEAQYWIVIGTVWIPFAALLPCVVAMFSFRHAYRLSVSLGRTLNTLRQASAQERVRIRQLIPDGSRVAYLWQVNPRWRALIEDK